MKLKASENDLNERVEREDPEKGGIDLGQREFKRVRELRESWMQGSEKGFETGIEMVIRA